MGFLNIKIIIKFLFGALAPISLLAHLEIRRIRQSDHTTKKTKPQTKTNKIQFLMLDNSASAPIRLCDIQDGGVVASVSAQTTTTATTITTASRQ